MLSINMDDYGLLTNTVGDENFACRVRLSLVSEGAELGEVFWTEVGGLMVRAQGYSTGRSSGA
jgi:hypothetical protein